MSNEIKAVYENGVFRPLEPVHWSDQQPVWVRALDAAKNQKKGEQSAFKKSTPQDEIWTEQKNQRRCDLIDKEIEGTLSSGERIELQRLQDAMLAYRRKVAPLPLDDLRELHQELLNEAAKKHSSS